MQMAVDLPEAADAERSILGSILLDPDLLGEAAGSLTAKHFANRAHGQIFFRMCGLAEAGRPIDYITLRDVLAKHGEVEQVGGIAFLASLTENMPRRLSIAEYVRIVRETAEKRQMLSTLVSAFESLSKAGSDSHEEMDRLLGRIAFHQQSMAGAERALFIGGHDFVSTANPHVDWTVDGLIQRGGNGLIVGDPGVSKSLLCFDLAVHLATGSPWMGRAVPRRMRVGIVTREDHPQLSRQRFHALLLGSDSYVQDAIEQIDLNEAIFFNTAEQCDSLALTDPADVRDLTAGLKAHRAEIVFFDVFNRLWLGDENSAQEVTRVLAVLTRISREVGCSCVLLHHLNKGEGSVFKRVRGSGAIHGWREWAFGVTVENPNDAQAQWVRRIDFECKAAQASSPLHFRVHGAAGKITLMQAEPPERPQRMTGGRRKRWSGTENLYAATNWQDRG